MAHGPYYDQVDYWAKHYGTGESDDLRSVHSFMDCETEEKIRSLRGQIYSISCGRYHQRSLDNQIGPARRLRHGSFEAWAKLMLQWMAGHRG